MVEILDRHAQLPLDVAGWPVPAVALASNIQIHSQGAREALFDATVCWFCALSVEAPFIFVGGKNAVQYKMFNDPPICQECLDFCLKYRDNVSYLSVLAEDEEHDTERFQAAARPKALFVYRCKSYRLVTMNGTRYVQVGQSRDVTALDPETNDDADYELTYQDEKTTENS